MMADSCEPLAVSWQLKVLNDGGWQDVILSVSEGSAPMVRKTENGIVTRSEESITLMTPYRLSSPRV